MSMSRKTRNLLISLVLLVLLSLALAVGLRKTVTLSVDGESHTITTYAFRVGDLLRLQNIQISAEDKLSPSTGTWLRNGTSIILVRAIPVQILDNGEITSIFSPDRVPSTLLEQAGAQTKSGDVLLSNGRVVSAGKAFPDNVVSISLQVIHPVSFTLTANGETETLTSTAPTLGSALWVAGYILYANDMLIPNADTALRDGLAATLTRSRLVSIQTQVGDVSFRTAAHTVDEALEAAHLSLQGLDYSIPAADSPIPSDGKLRLVRVTEQVLIEQTPIPFTTEYQPDPDLELDSQSILQAGAYGMTAQRVRVRYEDGVEASRKVDSEWVALQPEKRIIGFGTSVVMHTTTVDGVQILYWRSLTVWVTSYHPSETGSNRTATGALVAKGVVGVNPNYIPYYTQMYIPGYGNGVALDTGNIGARWIDLAYPDDEYIPWHQYVTIYFTWPPPDNIVWIIP